MGQKTEGFDKEAFSHSASAVRRRSRPHQNPLESLSASRTYGKPKLSTLILGVGNPILGDDGVGIAVARKLANLAADVKEAETLGLDVLNTIEGYGKVIIVDAIVAPREKTGKIIRIETPEKAMTAHSASPHDTSFASALNTGRKLGMKIPKIVVYGINVEQKNLEEFREGLSPKVERAARKAANLILKEIGG